MDGNGRRDIWNSVPDALATAANLLARNGWQTGQTWGYEVVLPAGRKFPAGSMTLARWAAIGVVRANGKPFPRPSDNAVLKVPDGRAGPAFLMTKNFYVLKHYNNADTYALAVGLLADEIAGYGGLVHDWSRPFTRLTIAETEELQKRLSALGYYDGDIDGLIGEGSRSAIRAFQASAGLTQDGHPSKEVLDRAEAQVNGRTALAAGKAGRKPAIGLVLCVLGALAGRRAGRSSRWHRQAQAQEQTAPRGRSSTSCSTAAATMPPASARRAAALATAGRAARTPRRPPRRRTPAVDKLDNARVVLVVGDFLAGRPRRRAGRCLCAVAGSARRRQLQRLVRLRARRLSTTGPAASAAILDEEKPAVVVVMIGSNDRQQLMVDGTREQPRSDAWTKEYEARALRFAKVVRDRGHSAGLGRAAVVQAGFDVGRHARLQRHLQGRGRQGGRRVRRHLGRLRRR